MGEGREFVGVGRKCVDGGERARDEVGSVFLSDLGDMQRLARARHVLKQP